MSMVNAVWDGRIKPEAPKAMVYTLSGKKIDLYNFKHSDVVIEDIARPLSHQGRYNGQTNRMYSVAEHTNNLVEYALTQGMEFEVQKALLLHDAAEAYIGDVVYHLKRFMPSFSELDKKISKIIFERFGVDYESVKDKVLELDRAICIDEMNSLGLDVDPCFEKQGVKQLFIPMKNAGLNQEEIFMGHYRRLFNA